jgi:hypothetical protein
MPQLQVQTPKLVITLMDTQSMAIPVTLQEQHWSLAGIQLIHHLIWCPSSPITPQVTLLELATWIMPMVTPFHLVMAMSWFLPTIMHPTIMQEKPKGMFVALPHKLKMWI